MHSPENIECFCKAKISGKTGDKRGSGTTVYLLQSEFGGIVSTKLNLTGFLCESPGLKH